jgi:hypothetical protein
MQTCSIGPLWLVTESLCSLGLQSVYALLPMKCMYSHCIRSAFLGNIVLPLYHSPQASFGTMWKSTRRDFTHASIGWIHVRHLIPFYSWFTFPQLVYLYAGHSWSKAFGKVWF